MKTNKIFAEIVTIGDEILYGEITDTNSQWISQELSKIGVKTIRKSSVGDDESEILQILSEAYNRADIIIITGGLGPTNDDITKKTIAKYFQCGMVLNEGALQDVKEFFEKRGRELTEVNRQQALIPEAGKCLRNKWGTAPGMWLEKNGKVFVSLPGVPYEMKKLMEFEVLPGLKANFKCPVIYHKVIKTIGIGESYLAEKIKDWESNLPSYMKLAYLPSIGEVKLRLSSMGDSEDELINSTNAQVEKLKSLAGEYIFGYDNDTIAGAIGKLLNDRKLIVSSAESCTGGFVGHLITLIPGSSAYFTGGVIAYDNKVKKEILGVKEETLKSYGAVSEETVKEMAEGVRKKFKTDIGISSSGIAGPTGGTPQKPVGTIWLGYSDGDKTIAKQIHLGNDREINIRQTGMALLNYLRQSLVQNS